MKLFLFVASLVISAFGQSLDKEKALCLHAHNVLRALHQNTGPLQWDENLARGSEQWAMKLVNEGGLRHSRGNYGENLYSSWGTSSSCAKAILSWYNEIKDFDFNNGGFGMGTGHFTQIVWKGSTKVGVGIAKRGTKVVICARYSPAGNFRGRYRENVLRPKPGSRIPSLSELESGVTVPSTNEPPLPPTQDPNPPPLTNKPQPPTTTNLCLHAHNVLRSLHQNTGPMQWDGELARGSEEWAKKLANEGGLRHSRGSYGENLYAAWGQSASCAKAILSWYDEIKDYNFNRGGYQSGTGHFTQIVWKGSIKLGVGIAKRGNMVVVCARYSPQGNWMSKFGENVFRQKSGARVPSLGELENGITQPSTGVPPKPQPETQQPQPPPTRCKDESSKCRYFKQKCGWNSWIRNRCKKTCNAC